MRQSCSKAVTLYFIFLFFPHSQFLHAQVITTIAGSNAGVAGYSGDGGKAINSLLNRPHGLAFDSKGNLYISERDNNRIRRIDGKTNIITTVVGTGTGGYNGDSLSAELTQLNKPEGIYFDSKDNLYICDGGNYVVRMVNAKTKKVTIIAGHYAQSGGNTINTPMPAKSIYITPENVTFNKNGDMIIVDWLGGYIWRVDTSARLAITIAGDNLFGAKKDGSPANQTELLFPYCVAFDQDYNMYIAVQWPGKILKADANTTIITTVAGNGLDGYGGDGGNALNASPGGILCMYMDSLKNIYIGAGGMIRKIDGQTNIITTIAGQIDVGYSGDGGAPTKANLKFPNGIAFDKKGNMYIADDENNAIRKVDFTAVLAEGLSKLYAQQINNSVLLKWQSSNNINTTHYTIERSENGRDFTAIGMIGVDTTVSPLFKYQFTDERPAEGTNYYRVKELSKDGFYINSTVVSVAYESLVAIKISPNPVRNILVINGLSSTKPSDISIIGSNGQVLQTIHNLTGNHNVNIQSLAPGNYYLKIWTGKTSQVLSFIKQ